MSLALLKSEELRRAAEDALRGSPQRLEHMLVFHSGLPGPKPNWSLAEAVGEALAGEAKAGKLIARLAGNVAAPDTAEVFLPVVAAHAYTALLARKREEGVAWAALAELASDERIPVRSGTENALLIFARRGGTDAIAAGLAGWLDDESRDRRWGAAATMLDALAADRSMEGMKERQAFLASLTWLLEDVANAPRAAERSEGRRRVLSSLGRITAAVAATFRAEPDGTEWLKERLLAAKHPDVRRAFDEALERLKKRGGSEKVATLVELHGALASSAKPDRHAARREPGMTSRGKKQRGR